MSSVTKEHWERWLDQSQTPFLSLLLPSYPYSSDWRNLPPFSALPLLSSYMVLFCFLKISLITNFWHTSLAWIFLSDTKFPDQNKNQKNLIFTCIAKRTLSVKVTQPLFFIKLEPSILSLEKRLIKNLRLGNQGET